MFQSKSLGSQVTYLRLLPCLLVVWALFLSVACATSPLGRKQLMLVPETQMDQMGAEAFQQLKVKEAVDTQPDNSRYVHCLVGPLTVTTQNKYPGEALPKSWETVVFKSDSVNAFALPGGKVGVYTGLLKVAKTDAQLAAVLGHEIGHVIARHGAERMSQQAGTQLGLAALGHLTRDNPNRDILMGLLGVGVQVGILLPYSREQEREADLIGLDLMAIAGFDPRQSVALWKNMILASSGKEPPQILSTHPASLSRIEALQKHMPDALVLFNQAHAEGRRPVCIPPALAPETGP